MADHATTRRHLPAPLPTGAPDSGPGILDEASVQTLVESAGGSAALDAEGTASDSVQPVEVDSLLGSDAMDETVSAVLAIRDDHLEAWSRPRSSSELTGILADPEHDPDPDPDPDLDNVPDELQVPGEVVEKSNPADRRPDVDRLRAVRTGEGTATLCVGWPEDSDTLALPARICEQGRASAQTTRREERLPSPPMRADGRSDDDSSGDRGDLPTEVLLQVVQRRLGLGEDHPIGALQREAFRRAVEVLVQLREPFLGTGHDGPELVPAPQERGACELALFGHPDCTTLDAEQICQGREDAEDQS
jgi:hypothetical protein